MLTIASSSGVRSASGAGTPTPAIAQRRERSVSPMPAATSAAGGTSHRNRSHCGPTKPARADGIDAWYFTAIDIRTGKVAWSRLTGTGIQWNNHYASIYLGPDGAAYIATLIGLVRVTDG